MINKIIQKYEISCDTCYSWGFGKYLTKKEAERECTNHIENFNHATHIIFTSGNVDNR